VRRIARHAVISRTFDATAGDRIEPPRNPRQLNVKDDRFEVLVWFKGYPERLVVPFNAIKALYDRTELKCSGS
jgi:hypothetical protein